MVVRKGNGRKSILLPEVYIRYVLAVFRHTSRKSRNTNGRLENIKFEHFYSHELQKALAVVEGGLNYRLHGESK